MMEGTDVPDGTATTCPAASALLVTPPGTTSAVHFAGGWTLCSGLEVHPVIAGTTGTVL